MSSELQQQIVDAANANGVPPALFAALVKNESGGNQGAVSSQGAIGLTQLLPATAKGLGVDPNDPVQNLHGGAKYLRQAYEATGNWDDATRYYHGGPNTKAWGPKGEAYHQAIVADAARYTGPQGTPLAPQNEPNDPYAGIIKNAMAGSNANTPSSQIPSGAPIGNSGDSPVGSVSPQQQNQNSGGNQNQGGASIPSGASSGGITDASGSGNSGTRQPDPNTYAGASAPKSFFDHFVNGLIESGANLGAGAMHGISGLAQMADPRHLFVLPGDPQFNAKNASIDANNPVSEWANRVGTSLNIASDQFGGNGGQNQNGLDSVGRFVGDVAATLPLAEMKITQGAGEGASMLARALHGGINLGAQGAVGGAELSGGQNVGQNAGAGAALAAALGGAGSAVAPKVADAVSKLAGTKLGQALIDSAKKLGIQVDPSRTDAPYLQWLHDQSEYVSSAENYRKAVADMVNSGMAADDIRAYAKRVGFDPNGMSNLDDVVAYKKDNLNATVGAQFTRPLTPITPEQAKTAMGSRADDVGTFHANPGLTPDVQAEATQLAAQGIPLAHALAEARIKSIGAQDNPALVTRDPALQREFNEGAKLNTPEGQALNAQKTGNNAAAIKAMNDAVAKYGDAPAAGDAHEAAAKALASASDAKQSAVDAAYKAARSADPEARIEPNALYKVLNSDEARAVPTNTPEGALLANTRSAIDLAQNAGGTKLLPKGMIPDAFNNISKMANRKYGADGATNYWIGKVTKAAQDDLNQVDSIGGPWQEAKNLHAQYATEFQDPQAVRNIIARDRGGNFVNQDAWPKLDKNFVGPDATNFAQITDALKNNGATDVIDMMRAHVAHNAMIAGKGQNGGNAVDQMINSNLSGKAYLNYLDKVGQNRMNMLFSPDQQAKLANIGHATNFINEPVPNTVNTSNTDSANANRLAQALAMAKGRSATEITLPKLVAGAVGGAVGHFVPGGEVLGSAIGMGAKQALDAAKTARANKAVAETLMSLKTSQSSRDSAVNDNAKILAEALARQRGAQSGVLAPAILNNKKGSK